MANYVVSVTETLVDIEGIDIVTTKEGTRQVYAVERLVLKRIREIFEKKYMMTIHL